MVSPSVQALIECEPHPLLAGGLYDFTWVYVPPRSLHQEEAVIGQYSSGQTIPTSSTVISQISFTIVYGTTSTAGTSVHDCGYWTSGGPRSHFPSPRHRLTPLNTY